MIFLHENVDEDLEMCAVNPVEEGSRDAYISATRPIGSPDLRFDSTSKGLKRKINQHR